MYLPLTIFSWKSSLTIFTILDTFTLFTRPLMLFFSASQAIRWNCSLVLSVIVACMARSLAGGMYAPPLRIQVKTLSEKIPQILIITRMTNSSICIKDCSCNLPVFVVNFSSSGVSFFFLEARKSRSSRVAGGFSGSFSSSISRGRFLWRYR